MSGEGEWCPGAGVLSQTQSKPCPEAGQKNLSPGFAERRAANAAEKAKPRHRCSGYRGGSGNKNAGPAYYHIDPRETNAETPWEALIGSGARGIGARLVGSGALRLRTGQARRLRAVLDRGFLIQVLTPSEAAWRAVMPALCRALGLAVTQL